MAVRESQTAIRSNNQQDNSGNDNSIETSNNLTSVTFHIAQNLNYRIWMVENRFNQKRDALENTVHLYIGEASQLALARDAGQNNINQIGEEKQREINTTGQTKHQVLKNLIDRIINIIYATGCRSSLRLVRSGQTSILQD